MKIKTGKNTIGSTPDQYLTVDAEEANKIAALLIQKYKSRVTPIREIVINGLESTANAVKEGREFRPVEITITMNDFTEDEISPFRSGHDILADGQGGVITITDHGEGMSPEFMTEKFTRLGKSTKDQDTTAVGGFGIGSKSVLSLTDYATWRTVRDEVATVLVMSQDNKGVTINHESMPAPGEDNGTTVTIPVDGSVMRYINEHIQSEFLDYVPSDQVTVTTEGYPLPVGGIVDNVIHTASNGVQFLPLRKKDRSSLYHARSTFHVMVNGAPYPVPSGADANTLDSDSAPWRSKAVTAQYQGNHHLGDFIRTGDMIINLDQNHPDVTILPSREALVESNALNRLIEDMVNEAVAEMVGDTIEKINTAETITDWLDSLREFAGSDLFDILDGYSFSMINYARHLSTEGYSSVSGGRKYSPFMVYSVENGDRTFADLNPYQGKVFTGDYDVSLRQRQVLPERDSWKVVLNSMVKLTNSRTMGAELVNASTISEIIEGDTIGFLLPESKADSNRGNLEAMSMRNLVPGFITIDSLYEHFGLQFSEITPLNVRDGLTRRIREAPDGGNKKSSVAASMIIVHRYVAGEGFVEVSAPVSVPALGRWLDEHTTDFTGKVLFSPEVRSDDGKEPSLWTTATGDQADRMMSSTDMDGLMIVRSIRDNVNDKYNIRVVNEVRSRLSVLTTDDFPVRNRSTSNRYSYWHIGAKLYSWVEAFNSAKNYFSDDEVTARLAVADCARIMDISLDQVINEITVLEELSHLTDDHGDSMLDVLVENFEVCEGFSEIMALVNPDDEGRATSGTSFMLSKTVNALHRNPGMVSMDVRSVIDTLSAIHDIHSFLKVDEHGIATVLPLFISMSKELN